MLFPKPLKSLIKDSLQWTLSPRCFVWRMKKHDSHLALTFDDGPDPMNTPIILDILGQNKILGTFFIAGDKAIRYPEIVNRIVEDGHELGNHTYSHQTLPSLNKRRIKEEVKGNQELLLKITGVQTNLFRPPQTRINCQSLIMLIKMKQTVVLWSISSEDYLNQGIAPILENVNDRTVHGGDIVVFHDQSDDTNRALPKVINNLKEAGFNFCTVSKLIYSSFAPTN